MLDLDSRGFSTSVHIHLNVVFHSPQFLSIHFLLLQAQVSHQSHAPDLGLSEAKQLTSHKAATGVTLSNTSYPEISASPRASVLARLRPWSSKSGLSQAKSGYGSTMSDLRLILMITYYHNHMV